MPARETVIPRETALECQALLRRLSQPLGKLTPGDPHQLRFPRILGLAPRSQKLPEENCVNNVTLLSGMLAIFVYGILQSNNVQMNPSLLIHISLSSEGDHSIFLGVHEFLI